MFDIAPKGATMSTSTNETGVTSMDLTTFEALVIEYKEIQFNDEKWEKADSLLEQIADIHTTNPELFEPIMKKHRVSY